MTAKLLVGNAPCSWGTLEFAGIGENTITYDRMLDELAAAGYTGTALGDWGFMPTDPAALAGELARRGLAITDGFVPVAFKDAAAHEAGEATARRVARLMAETAARTAQPVAPFLVLADANGTDPVRTQHAGRITPERGLGDDEWAIFAAGVERIARAVQAETGLRTVFHHHCAGYVETHAEIDRLLALTDPALVGLVFDTGHYAFGNSGCDAITHGLDAFAERIWYHHFKDCSEPLRVQCAAEGWDYFTAIRRGIFCELGQGSVDFPAVRRWLETHAYAGIVTVEQDILPGMGSPYQSAVRSREYLRGIGM